MYVGNIKRGQENCFGVSVKNSNTDTMTRVIVVIVAVGSLIITDKWRAFEKALSEIRVTNHLSVNYSLNFVDLVNLIVHTYNIKGLLSRSII